MRSIIFLIIMYYSAQLFSQNFNCDQYRKIMDEEMAALDYSEKDKIFIIGKNGEYYKIGMSDYFSSEPKVPNYIYEKVNINPHMAKIIVAHVDLYHCDLVEKEQINNRSTTKVGNEVEVNIFPNPTSGFLNIESKNQILNVVIFNSSGSLLQRIDKDNGPINLLKFVKGIYYLQITTKSGNAIKKIILD